MAVDTFSEKLDYLVQRTGRAETELVAEALNAGLDGLYRKHIADAYLAGDLDRPQAVDALGEDAVEGLDYARSAVESDVAWGLKRG